jgi:hypothetical protein
MIPIAFTNNHTMLKLMNGVINKDSTDISSTFDFIYKMLFCNDKQKIYNSNQEIKKNNLKEFNMCNCCKDNIFIHKSAGFKFIEKVVQIYQQHKKNFHNNKYFNMIAIMVLIEDYYSTHLKICDQNLFQIVDNHNKTIGRMFIDRNYILPGIINQYNEMNGKNNDHWFVVNNIKCLQCEKIFCSFHHDHALFKNIYVNGNEKYICGWCVDKIMKRKKLFENNL